MENTLCVALFTYRGDGKSLAPTRKETNSETCQGRARFQQHRDANCHQVFIFPSRQGAEGNCYQSHRQTWEQREPYVIYHLTSVFIGSKWESKIYLTIRLPLTRYYDRILPSSAEALNGEYFVCGVTYVPRCWLNH